MDTGFRRYDVSLMPIRRPARTRTNIFEGEDEEHDKTLEFLLSRLVPEKSPSATCICYRLSACGANFGVSVSFFAGPMLRMGTYMTEGRRGFAW